MNFSLTKKEVEKFNTWVETHEQKCTGRACCGRYVFSFCPTRIGTVVKARDDLLGEEIDLTDYENW